MSEILSLSEVIIGIFPVSAGSDKALFEAMFNFSVLGESGFLLSCFVG